jgi:hypothetical protein
MWGKSNAKPKAGINTKEKKAEKEGFYDVNYLETKCP